MFDVIISSQNTCCTTITSHYTVLPHIKHQVGCSVSLYTLRLRDLQRPNNNLLASHHFFVIGLSLSHTDFRQISGGCGRKTCFSDKSHAKFGSLRTNAKSLVEDEKGIKDGNGLGSLFYFLSTRVCLDPRAWSGYASLGDSCGLGFCSGQVARQKEAVTGFFKIDTYFCFYRKHKKCDQRIMIP